MILCVVNRRPKLEIIAPAASPEEAAAVVAALERFMRDTAPPPAPEPPAAQRSAWARASLLEATGHRHDEHVPWNRHERRPGLSQGVDDAPGFRVGQPIPIAGSGPGERAARVS